MSRVRTGDKGAAILQAALQLFVGEGVSATSMARIAAGAGIGVGTLYLYYANKDAVVVACAQAFADEHTAHSEQVTTATGSPTERLQAYVLARFRLWQPVSTASPGAAELAQSIVRLCPEQMAHFATLFASTLQRLLTAAMLRGEVKTHDPVAAAEALSLALTPFFPFPGNTQPFALDEAALTRHLKWLLRVALAA